MSIDGVEMKKKAVKKKVSQSVKPAPKKASLKKAGSPKNLEGKILDLYKKNKELQSEINKAKKKYEQLEKESLKLTKELMEAGYIPKNLTKS